MWFEYDRGHSGHSFRTIQALVRHSLLEMQRTGFLQIYLRLLLSCLQLAEKEKYIISPQFNDKLSNPYNLVMINLLFVN